MKIEIPEDCKTVNILFSGGTDSTILLYLLVKEKIETNNNVTIITNSFGKTISKNAYNSVLNYIENLFGIKILHRNTNNNFYIRDFVKLLLELDGGYVYSGCNKVLTDEFTPTVYIKNDTPPVRGPAYNEHHIRPFIEMDKVEILQLYIDNNLLDLLELTHSCGIGTDVVCGGCYFCMERSWAEKKLGINPNGVYNENV